MVKSGAKAGPSLPNRRRRRRADPNRRAERGRNRRRRNAPDLDLKTGKIGRRTDPEGRDRGKSGATGTPIAADSEDHLVMVRDVGLHLKEVAAPRPPIAVGGVRIDLLPKEENDPRKGKRSPEALRQLDRQSLHQRNAICARSCACSCLPRCASVICANSCRRWVSSATSASSQTLEPKSAKASPTSNSNPPSQSPSLSDSLDKSCSEYPFKCYRQVPRKTEQRRTILFKESWKLDR